ncbi:MAG: TetR/AcrR family transcriptional regulator [Pseudomonadota bacterium]
MTTASEPKRKRGRPPRAQQVGKSSIITAALKEFARCGYRGSSIDAIARSAGVAKALVYYHFGSKEALWRASVSEAFDTLKDEASRFSGDLEHGDRAVAIERFAGSIVKFSSKNPWLVRIALDETRQGGERAQWLKRNYLLPLQRMLVPIIDRIFGTGQAPRHFAAHLIPTVFGAINFAFIDDDVIAEAHRVDVHSEVYIAQQAELIAVILRAMIDQYAGEA